MAKRSKSYVHGITAPPHTSLHAYLGRIRGLDSLDMVRDHTSPVALIKVDSVTVLRSLAIAARQRVSVLPEHVCSDAFGVDCGSLPRVLVGAAIVATI